MIESFIFHRYKPNKVGVERSMYFNEQNNPFREFTTEVEWRQEDEPKSQDHGLWDTKPLLGKRVFRVEGDILRDNSSEYMNDRLDLLGMFDPVYGSDVVGYLEIQWTGIPEVLTAEVSMDGYPELPITALAPARGSYMIAWKAPDPYLYGFKNPKVTMSKDVSTPIYVAGNAPTRKVTYELVAGPVSGQDIVAPITITHSTYEISRVMNYNRTLLGGVDAGSGRPVPDDVLFDVYNRVVTDPGRPGTIRDPNAYFSGTWLTLLRGHNGIMWTHSASGSFGRTLTVQWQNAYLV